MALSFVEKLLKQLQQTGDLSPILHGGGPKPKLNIEQLSLPVALVKVDNDATLDELCEQFKAQTAITISRLAMGRLPKKETP